jgi:hypothetical protein
MILTFSITILPYVIFIHSHTGEWSLGKKSSAVFNIAYNMVTAEHGYEKSHFGISENVDGFPNTNSKVSFLNYFYSNPTAVLKFYFSNIYTIFDKLICKLIPVVLFVPMGIRLLKKDWDIERFKKDLYLFIFLIPPIFLYPFFLTHYRRFVPFTPIIILLAAPGIVNLQALIIRFLNMFNPKRFDKSYPYIEKLLKNGIVGIIVFFVFWQTITNRENPGDIRYKELGLWLKNHISEESVIMARHPIIAFYACKKHVEFPYAEDFNQIFKYAKSQRINYLVVDYNLIKFRKHLAYLRSWYEGKDFPSELKLIKEIKDNQSKKILVYEFLTQDKLNW